MKRPALRYHGAKWRLAPWIIANLPEHSCYVEPFAGGASILLRKSEVKAEVLNDIDGEVVNFWRVLRERTDEFIKEIELSPFSREESTNAYEIAKTPLERARRFFVRSWQQRGGPRAKWHSGWRHATGVNRSNIPSHDWAKTDHLWDIAARLKAVQLENDDALRVIERFDREETCFYVDPPYVAETRSQRWRGSAYTYEINEEYHVKLAKLLSGIRGSAVVSGYPSKQYEDLYRGWKSVEKEAMCDSHYGAKWRKEVLWIREASAVGLFDRVVKAI